MAKKKKRRITPKDNILKGLFKENPKLFDRVGDYTLILKENYLIKDNILNQKRL